jgi:hypothetical protein
LIGSQSEKRGPASFPAGPFGHASPIYRIIVMQQGPQQPAALDEIVVELASVMIAAIKSRYFMIFSC